MDRTVLVVEDDDGIREYVMELLKDNGYLVKGANTGTKAIRLVDKILPELVLLDLKLPDIPGENVCTKIKELHPEVFVIMLTAKDSPEDVKRGLDMGADDYIKKPFDERELLARIRARLREGREANHILRVKDLSLNQKTFEVKRKNEIISLTPLEFKLLEYMMLNKNQVLSRDRILNRVWKYSPEVESRVVDVYIGYLRKKVDEGYKDKIIQSVRGFGYKIQD